MCCSFLRDPISAADRIILHWAFARTMKQDRFVSRTLRSFLHNSIVLLLHVMADVITVFELICTLPVEAIQFLISSVVFFFLHEYHVGHYSLLTAYSNNPRSELD